MARDILKFRCYACGQLIGATRSKANRIIECPKCAVELLVPGPEAFEDLESRSTDNLTAIEVSRTYETSSERPSAVDLKFPAELLDLSPEDIAVVPELKRTHGVATSEPDSPAALKLKLDPHHRPGLAGGIGPASTSVPGSAAGAIPARKPVTPPASSPPPISFKQLEEMDKFGPLLNRGGYQVEADPSPSRDVEASTPQRPVQVPPVAASGSNTPLSELAQTPLPLVVAPTPTLTANSSSMRVNVTLPRAAVVAWSILVLLAVGMAFTAGLLVGHFVWIEPPL